MQQRPGRQRAALLLHDVLGWSVQEIATLLDISVAASNSVLQRARARLGQPLTSAATRMAPAREQALLERYMRAWEKGDVDELATLLAEGARLSMPPLAEWYAGSDAITEFFRWATSGDGPGPYTFIPTRASARPAFGIYAAGEPLVLQVVEADAAGIRAITSFMNSGLFRFFDLVELSRGRSPRP